MKKAGLLTSIIFFTCYSFADNFGNASLFGANSSAGNNTTSSSSSNDIMVPPIVGASGLSSTAGSTGSATLNLPDNTSKANKLAISSQQATPSKSGVSELQPKAKQISEFQNNVMIRTGKLLPIYGNDLFMTPTSFSPNQNAPVPSNYTIAPGDVITMQTWGAVDSSLSLNVENDGTIFIPKVGTVNVAGVKSGNLDTFLSGKVGKFYRNFSLSSSVGKISSIQVTVAGFANQPGTYNLSSLSTLENAVFAVGGPSNAGSMRNVELRRNGKTITHFDLYSALLNGKSSNVRIVAGDVIYFTSLGDQAAIYDGVKVPGIYEMRANETVKNLVDFAGGYSYDNRGESIVIEQVGANKQINVLNYSLQNGLHQPVSNGAIIHFFTTHNEYAKSIVLIGNVANPTRVAYHPGITVHDIIQNKEMLLTKSYWNSYNFNTYGRDSILTSMGQEKSTFKADKSSDDSSANGDSSLSQQNNTQQGNTQQNDTPQSIFSRKQNLVVAGPIQIPEADINWSYALVVRTNPQNYKVKLIPFNLKLALEGDPKNNVQLQPGDIINVLSSKDVRAPVSTDLMYVFIDGEVNNPGVYQLPPKSTLLDLIKTAGGSTTDSYFYGLELSRASVKQRQMRILNQMLDQLQQTLLAQSSNAALSTATAQGAQTQQVVMQQQQAFLDKMRQVKPNGRVVLNFTSSNITESDLPKITLENGDTVYIPATPTVIDVVGQVYNPATFQYNKGYTVGKYIDLAGTENQFADSSQEYVLRADGTLYSKQQAGWFGSFASQTLNPGDSIIVPQQIQFGGAMQNLLNWTQILSNFGTAAAAITVFKN